MTDAEAHDGQPHSVMDVSLALSPGWQVDCGHQSRVLRRHNFGLMAEVAQAPLCALEFDVLAWLCGCWYRQGRPTIDNPPNAVVRFTLSEITQALAKERCKDRLHQEIAVGREVSYSDLVRTALDSLTAAVATLTGVNAHTGERIPRALSRVNIVRSYTVTGDWEDPSALGSMCDVTIEVRLEDWLTERLGVGALVLDWATQRRLGGSGKRLWAYLEARSTDFTLLKGGLERLSIDVDKRLLHGLGLNSARHRDNLASLDRALAKILQGDDRYSPTAVAERVAASYGNAEEPLRGVPHIDIDDLVTALDRRTGRLTVTRIRRDESPFIEVAARN